ncbi:hypothetical protein FSZ17_08460 [Cytobacillus dafuensis]|uniref:BshB3 potential contributor to bacillithiol synthesis n=1 Tax=Cytobacillus dafuensis TaxID=1742359 RepID=A0A5B8Z4S4_CYTDA|nr:hypothetical protein FSZ17_08460 [Cytobacillus dafuensis]
MKIMFALVFCILFISIVLTLLVTRNGDENYSSSTRRNNINLSLIYGVIIILAIIALGVYITFFA